jgi:hypothetical protein
LRAASHHAAVLGGVALLPMLVPGRLLAPPQPAVPARPALPRLALVCSPLQKHAVTAVKGVSSQVRTKKAQRRAAHAGRIADKEQAALESAMQVGGWVGG